MKRKIHFKGILPAVIFAIAMVPFFVWLALGLLAFKLRGRPAYFAVAKFLYGIADDLLDLSEGK